jgi:hypothetical protein
VFESTSILAIILLALVLAGVAFMLFRIIGRLRRTASRYRWFELFTAVFLAGWGFLMLFMPRRTWPWWWPIFAGGGTLSGGIYLGEVLMLRFQRKATGGILRCSFCNKSQRDVRRLIAGPTSYYICDECVEICRKIVRDSPPLPDDGTRSCALCGTERPKDQLMMVLDDGGFLCEKCQEAIRNRMKTEVRE